jgi:DNA-binding NarL/FixJ family response regulator
MSIEAEKMAEETSIDAYVHKSSDFNVLEEAITNVLKKRKASN